MQKLLITCAILIACIFTVNAQNETVYPDGLNVGDVAPDFSAKDQTGNTVSLVQALKNGPVVLLFYRGQWCPYCNKQMSQMEDSLQLLTSKNATVIAITPETGENVQKTVQKTKASFAVLEDAGLSLMNAYKVTFAVDEKTITRYKKFGIDFEKANGSNGANLPVPATYIIGTDGKIKYVYFNTVYKLRASVAEILSNL